MFLHLSRYERLATFRAIYSPPDLPQTTFEPPPETTT